MGTRELPAGCHRSHPHENMDADCERLTEIARLRSVLAAARERIATDRDVWSAWGEEFPACARLSTDYDALLRQIDEALVSEVTRPI